MAFIASNGLTEDGTSRTIEAGGMTVHYHDIGTGEPVLCLCTPMAPANRRVERCCPRHYRPADQHIQGARCWG